MTTTEHTTENMTENTKEAPAKIRKEKVNTKFNTVVDKEVPIENSTKVIAKVSTDVIKEINADVFEEVTDETIQKSNAQVNTKVATKNFLKVNEEVSTEIDEEIIPKVECEEELTLLVFKEQGYMDKEGNYDEDKLFVFFDQLMDGIYTNRKRYLFMKELFQKCIEKKATPCETIQATMNCASNLFTKILAD